MPNKKRWIIDEKGYHAVSGFVSAPSNYDLEDTNQGNRGNNESNYAVKLLQGKWLPGENGFQFNKKCNLQVTGKYLKKTNNKKVTIETFVKFEGEDEDLGQQVEAFFNDECIAETEVTLFYGEKYGIALENNPSATCHYLFKAHNNVCEKDIESELLTMPREDKAENKFIYLYPKEKLKKIAQDLPESYFIFWSSGIFGFDIPQNAYKDLHQEILNDGLSFPECIILDETDDNLSGHQASYDQKNEYIYISKKIMEAAKTDNNKACKLLIALTEELGHFLDDYIRKKNKIGGDGPKDEGAYFAWHLLIDDCEKVGSSDIGHIASDQNVIKFNRSDMTEAYKLWLNRDRLEWDRKKRHLSFFAGGTTVDKVFIELKDLQVKLCRDISGHKKDTIFKIAQIPSPNSEKWHLNNGTKIDQIDAIHLIPVIDSTSGLTYYSVGLGSQRKAIDNLVVKLHSQNNHIIDWKNKENNYKKNYSFWESSLKQLKTEYDRLNNLAIKKKKIYRQMLVREIMYNRFDKYIEKWVKHYNTSLSPKKLLNGNIVKSMVFQETRSGTFGEHLELPPYNWNDGTKHPIRSRFNLMQTIDSYCPQTYLMIKELDKTIYNKYNLSDLEAQMKWVGMTETEYYSWNGGMFPQAMEEFAEKQLSGKNLMGNPFRPFGIFVDYEYWIRAGIRWLFRKYSVVKQSSWAEAVRAFNGAGPDAQHYKAEVISRVTGAKILDVGNK